MIMAKIRLKRGRVGPIVEMDQETTPDDAATQIISRRDYLGKRCDNRKEQGNGNEWSSRIRNVEPIIDGGSDSE
jgi:hypothetical protein